MTANSPFHIEIEKLSRLIWSPPQAGVSHQTRWFYERARGQYKNELDRQLETKQKNAFLTQTPKAQLLVKEELAKYINVWAKLPYYVVQGNQKNYRVFVDSLKTKKDQQPDSEFFEDLIAKAILFRSAEKIYGVKPNALGDLRYVTVPYTLAYLNQATNGKLNLLKVWKQQSISEALKALLPTLMIQVERYIKANAPGSLYGEWAKKESCWQSVSRQKFTIDTTMIKADLIDPANPPIRRSMTDDDAEKLQQQNNADWLCTVPAIIWDQIAEWGRFTTQLTFHQQQIAADMAKEIRQWRQLAPRKLSANEITAGLYILELVLEHNPKLLENMPDDTTPALSISSPDETAKQIEISVEQIQQAVAWDKRHKVLSIPDHLKLKEIAEGRKRLNDYTIPKVNYLLNKIKRQGFKLED